jgi:glutathione synthase/RimK-type ligase-like ATP-grasp enzyme
MNLSKITSFFKAKDYLVSLKKFSKLDMNEDYSKVFILYQSSESPGTFYKKYIENLIYFLEKQGAKVFPNHELLMAHHNKVFMEFLKSTFKDDSLKTIKSVCYGSWIEALAYKPKFPVVIKQPFGSGSEGVYLAKDQKEYIKYIKKAGNRIYASNIRNHFIYQVKILVKKLIKKINPEKSKYYEFETLPVSIPVIIQTFIEGLAGDYKVLIYGKKYYIMFRKNRKNDFRASGSGISFEVPENEYDGLLNFAHKLTLEIDYPIFEWILVLMEKHIT